MDPWALVSKDMKMVASEGKVASECEECGVKEDHQMHRPSSIEGEQSV